MHGIQAFHGFGFHNDLVIHQQVDFVGVTDQKPFKGDVQSDFGEHLVPLLPKGVGKADLVRFLKETDPKGILDPDGGLRSLQRDEPGDYTLQPWFKPGPAKGTWGEPHRLAGETAPLVDYLRPFRLPGAAEASGLVRLEVPLEHFHGMLRDIGLGFSGYPFLLSARTAFLAFPNPESIAAGKTLADLANETGNPRLRELARRQAVRETGYSYLNFLRTTIALFFSLVVAQFNIRGRVAATGVLYLEWYYFAMYCAILLVSIEALLFARTEHWLWSRDNALAKLWFWPALLSGFYVITALYLI